MLLGPKRRAGFEIQLTTTYVDIHHSNGKVNKGWFSISIRKNGIMVYISKDNNRIYWLASSNGPSAKLTLKFNDKKNMISVNNSNKITFHRPKDYDTIKKKAIYYKHMTANDNSIVFRERKAH